jgi:uncharacterized protein YbaP (TraB family)
MRMRPIFLKGFCAVLSLFLVYRLPAQATKKTPKYTSLLWEITGNGLKKPSYLFGTMHVSSKMVFHLSDSFYQAIRSSDMVALELNPQSWQPEMFRMQDAEKELGAYYREARTGYINEKSFRLQRYEDKIRVALSEEPTVVNGLLYRNFQQQADFEENTYLDLYIYQTGRKLGKQAGGVEDYWETQKVIMQGYKDMAIERAKKKNNDYDRFDGDENYYDIQKKIQDAYRKGDLDLLDSLEKKMETSAAFNEMFMYKRNEIQANSIDSILKKNSLFVGVGAAHLPGDRGVIELLRKKGYKLRPILMQNRDATQKESIDKLRVPVKFSAVNTADGFVKMMMPGPLFERGERSDNPSWQYADMENGAYYMLTRVATHAAIFGEDESVVLKKVDSLLYENIPGKILVKKEIVRNGYKGFDITNKTRRGDIQRYNIFVTPFEVLVFKMSGNDDYVQQGKEANDFFASIILKEPNTKPQAFEPASGGFKINLPHEPFASLRKSNDDMLDTWYYEAVDKSNDKSYMVWKKTINNFGFIEEDTFDLSLVEESLKGSELIEKELNRSFGILNGYPTLNMEFSLKEGGTMNAKALIRGPHYYLVAVTSKKKSSGKESLNSFAPTDFKRKQPAAFIDTFYHFSVNTPHHPTLDPEYRVMMEDASSEEFLNQTEYYNYGKKDRTATFYNDTTGETVMLTVTRFPKYYYTRDTARFFRNEYNTEKFEKDMILKSKETLRPSKNSFGYKYVFTDTNSSRKLVYAALLQNNRLFDIASVSDTLSKESDMVSQFISSFQPQVSDTVTLFRSKLNEFFADLSSKDSLTRKRSMDAAAQLYFGPQAIPQLKKVIDSLKWGDKDYFDLKSKFINELGYIDDSCCVKDVISYLNNIYDKTADTAVFQNTALLALSRLKTKESFSSLKEHLLQDPPIFDNDYDMDNMFNSMEDTLQLAKMFFPDILQLMTIEDYKSQVTSLLRTMVDSGYLKAKDYENYFSNIYFDAKIELKRQQSADVRQAEKENQEQIEERNGNTPPPPQVYRDTYSNSSNGSEVDNYAVLLMPFYEKNTAIRKFFDKLLQSKDLNLRQSTAVLMIRNNVPLHDSILRSIAEKDQYRASLLRDLEDIDREDLFPVTYKKQEDVARSLLLEEGSVEKFFDIKLTGKRAVQVKNDKGYVYFFKYKMKREDDWKIGISGIQPDSLSKVNSNNLLVSLTDKKLNAADPEMEQFEKQLKRLIYSIRNSSTNFYRENNKDYDFRGDGD